MKDELKDKMKSWKTFEDVKRDVDDWMDYYNNDRCIWKLAKLPPKKYYEYLKTGFTRNWRSGMKQLQGALPLNPGIYRLVSRGLNRQHQFAT